MIKWAFVPSSDSGELLRGKVVSMESRWMLNCFCNIYRDLVIGDLEHPWYLDCGRCTTPPYLLVINFTTPWYIWPNGIGQ